MGRFSYPAWDKDLQERVNATGGEGMPGIVQNFDLFNRAGVLAKDLEFLSKLRAAVDWQEAISRPTKLVLDRMPSDIQKLGLWMEHALSQFLGFPVYVPAPPKLNRKQARAFRKYGLRLFYVPAITEDQYPDHMVKPDWRRFLVNGEVKRIPLPGRWIAFETIKKPDYTEKVYPNDRLMEDLSVTSRFNHKRFDYEGGSYDVLTILKDIAQIIGSKIADVQLPSAEIWNFIANFMNWLREHTGEDFPNLGSTRSSECVANSYCFSNIICGLIVGTAEYEGLKYVFSIFNNEHEKNLGFRIMVVF